MPTEVCSVQRWSSCLDPLEISFNCANAYSIDSGRLSDKRTEGVGVERELYKL